MSDTTDKLEEYCDKLAEALCVGCSYKTRQGCSSGRCHVAVTQKDILEIMAKTKERVKE